MNCAKAPLQHCLSRKLRVEPGRAAHGWRRSVAQYPAAPYEASGTSGMKAALNGVPSLSILDGWWIEGWIEGVTGWAIDDHDDEPGEAKSLYEHLEKRDPAAVLQGHGAVAARSCVRPLR